MQSKTLQILGIIVLLIILTIKLIIKGKTENLIKSQLISIKKQILRMLGIIIFFIVIAIGLPIYIHQVQHPRITIRTSKRSSTISWIGGVLLNLSESNYKNGMYNLTLYKSIHLLQTFNEDFLLEDSDYRTIEWLNQYIEFADIQTLDELREKIKKNKTVLIAWTKGEYPECNKKFFIYAEEKEITYCPDETDENGKYITITENIIVLKTITKELKEVEI